MGSRAEWKFYGAVGVNDRSFHHAGFVEAFHSQIIYEMIRVAGRWMAAGTTEGKKGWAAFRGDIIAAPSFRMTPAA